MAQNQTLTDIKKNHTAEGQEEDQFLENYVKKNKVLREIRKTELSNEQKFRNMLLVATEERQGYIACLTCLKHAIERIQVLEAAKDAVDEIAELESSKAEA